jgi:branched-chain amino acid transport system ATP-binding protein
MADPMLELDRVNTYYGKAHILHDLSFTCRRRRGGCLARPQRGGQDHHHALDHAAGAAVTSGQVVFEGNDITRWPTHKVARSGLGYVPEERRIFADLTVMENLEVGRQPHREGYPDWTVEHLFELFPNLAERRNNRGKQMSGGEQQMLTIARTLMGNPKLLLLDEPSEGIAPVIVEQMAETLLEIKAKGLTVVLSEQNLHFARLVGDRAVIIESGSAVFDGTFAELEAHPEIRDQYLSV